jgi:hypothetical protein
MVLEVFHTPYFRDPPHRIPVIATGYEQWLGDGYYFWQDEYWAKWWGQNKKCGRENLARLYTIYKVELTFKEEDFIDTVFNEEDYYQFVDKIEQFAKKYEKALRKKPSLIEFNEFIEDFNIWQNIKVIRFQDLPNTDEHLKVSGFYYLKRIQIRVNDLSIITNFAILKTLACI